MSVRKAIVGVMGPGTTDHHQEPTDKLAEIAHELGKAVATAGFLLLTGGR